MKLLLDQNLSPRLVQALVGLFPGSIHLHECGLGESADNQVWDFAREKSLTILSKDSDFCELSALRGSPPKVIWLHIGNCSTAEIEALLRRFAVAIAEFINHPEDRCLVLTRRSFSRLRTGRESQT
jgi:predicted nuclease of predicted toxin-antitoxin system